MTTTGLSDVRNRIHATEKETDREVGATTLIAVSKTFDGDLIRPVLNQGQTVFGENRVQEAEGKWPALRDTYPETKLHLIGPLQSNKAKNAVALFDVIHTVDRLKVAKALATEMDKQDKRPDLFIQVNIGEEPQKAGIPISEADEFIEEVRTKMALSVIGLMCIPPVDEPAAPYFALLHKMAERNDLSGLSMGMSADFEEAIRFGATHIRVGSAIFGHRTKPY